MKIYTPPEKQAEREKRERNTRGKKFEIENEKHAVPESVEKKLKNCGNDSDDGSDNNRRAKWYTLKTENSALK